VKAVNSKYCGKERAMKAVNSKNCGKERAMKEDSKQYVLRKRASNESSKIVSIAVVREGRVTPSIAIVSDWGAQF
jgi:hypothetical protein